MSMLADRRFRKKYTLTPRGKALYDDDSRFGTKMLQKMGWSKEKGLGAQEDGSKDFVRVQFKNDASGLGYENRDDQWTQHEDNFNGFLKSLHNDSPDNDSEQQNETASDEERCVGFGFSAEVTEKQESKNKLKEKLSGQSLEERSKQSKARVHYKKFTRGKDLAQYSEKDLANIFGKKGNESEKTTSADTNEQLCGIEKKNKKETEEEVFENPLIISTGLSVNDYFKQKMEARKRQTEDNIDNEMDATSAPSQESEERKVKSKKRFDTTELNDTFENTEVSSSKKKSKKKKIKDESEINEVVPKKKKKKSDTGLLEESNTEKPEKALGMEQQIDGETKNAEGKSRKKKKKSKKQEVDENEVNLEYVEVTQIEDTTKTSKKKKLKKDKSQKLSTLEETNDTAKKEDDSQKIEIKCIENEEDNALELTNENEENISTRKKKQKSKNGKLNDQAIEIITLTDETEVNNVAAEKKVKKSKKRKLRDTEMETENNAVDLNNVSCNENKECEDNGALEALSLEELTDKCKSYNTYNLSTFCAEKFRNVNFERFPGSNMADISGYSHGDDLELNVKYIAKDEERIMRLWSCLSTKYNDSKAIYYQYVKKLVKTKNLKAKKKTRLNVARFKKRNIFQGI